jgi:hypothetical protein
MALQVNIKTASKVEWHTTLDNAGAYPGDTNIQLGCLMRIADASEKMATNFIFLQNERDTYKRWYDNAQGEIKALTKSNAALRGHIKRIKGKQV